jgi:hypothetical protein
VPQKAELFKVISPVSIILKEGHVETEQGHDTSQRAAAIAWAMGRLRGSRANADVMP